MSPAGIEPATFRFVAMHLKPLCYRGPLFKEICILKQPSVEFFLHFKLSM